MFFKNTAITRYISQKDKYNCGPVAIINYWKYLGFNVTYQDVKILSRVLGTEKPLIGTLYSRMEEILGKSWQRISVLNPPAIVALNNHYWFCANVHGDGTYLVINYIEGQTYGLISPEKMRSILKKAQVLLLGEYDV